MQHEIVALKETCYLSIVHFESSWNKFSVKTPSIHQSIEMYYFNEDDIYKMNFLFYITIVPLHLSVDALKI